MFRLLHDDRSPVGAGTHLPCGYMEQLRVCLKVLCNSQERHPPPLKVLISCGHTPSVPNPRVTLGPWLAQVHTYPVGIWNSSESASKCFATHKNGTHLHWSACKYLLVVVTPQCAPNPRVTLVPWLAQVHTYPVGTWNSSESAPKCFATHKNGTHLH